MTSPNTIAPIQTPDATVQTQIASAEATASPVGVDLGQAAVNGFVAHNSLPTELPVRHPVQDVLALARASRHKLG